MILRCGPPTKELASTSYNVAHPRGCLVERHARATFRTFQSLGRRGGYSHKIEARALVERDEGVNDKYRAADVAQSSEVVEQLIRKVAETDGYVPLSDAQSILSDVVGASKPAPPKFLKFCKNGEEVSPSITLNSNLGSCSLSQYVISKHVTR